MPNEKVLRSPKPNEEALSLSRPDEKPMSPIKLDEKTPSPVKLKEEAPSEVIAKDEATIQITVKQKVPSTTKVEETVTSPMHVKSLIFAPSTKHDHQDSHLKEDDRSPSLIEDDNRSMSPCEDQQFDKTLSVADQIVVDSKNDLLKKSTITSKIRSLTELARETEEMLHQEKQFISQLQMSTQNIPGHLVEKRYVLDNLLDDKTASISTIDSGITDRDSITHTLVHGSSSEDVSKEISLEEKYSYESTEKSDKKKSVGQEPSNYDSSYPESLRSIDSQKLDQDFYSSKDDSLALRDSTDIPIGEKRLDMSTDVISLKEEIPLLEASDSGLNSIPTEHMSDVGDGSFTQSMKDNASRFVESIHKAFGEDVVQQGIKTESLESIIGMPDLDRVSTPPTVPVSPLPKTPSGVQDLKVSEGVQSEVSYDKSDGSEETITKVVHVGEDILTQKISTSTEKVPRTSKSYAPAVDHSESELLALMQNVGKIKTETDTVTKIIKEGENVVTQTITTVTTKEIISRDDGTPQNVKTTIETTTLSKGADGSTTTTTDTQTLLSECSSSLRSTSQMDLYTKESKIEKDHIESHKESSGLLASFQLKGIGDTIQDESTLIVKDKTDSFVSEADDSDDNIEDTIIDTDVSKKIIRENNIDIVETITTTTKKETMRVSDSKKIMRTTVETNVCKEHPDGSKDVQKNVEVKTEELLLDSSSNLDKILSKFNALDQPEETVTTKTEEIKQEDFIIKRTTVTKIIKTKYADSEKIPKKLKTVTVITTTDSYPDGSSRTKVDTSTSLTDIEMETVEAPELRDFTLVEDKFVETETQEKSVIINGKNALQHVTRNTIKEILTNKQKSKKKLKTTIETVTETMLPDGMTEVTKDVKISVSDYEIDYLQDSLEGYEPVDDPHEDTKTALELVTENGILIKRKTVVTTTVQRFHNISEKIKRTRTKVKTVTEDEHPDGSIVTKTSENFSIIDESLETSLNGFSNEQDVKTSENSDIEKALKGFTIIGEPEIHENTTVEQLKENNITIKRTTITKVSHSKYSDIKGNICKILTVTEVTTTDQYPDGTSQTSVDTSKVVSNVDNIETVDHVISTEKQKDSSVGECKKSDSTNETFAHLTKNEVLESDNLGQKDNISEKVFYPDQNRVFTSDRAIQQEKIESEDSEKIETALQALTAFGQPIETETRETEEIKEKGITIYRTIITKTIKTLYQDDKGQLQKVKIATTSTTTDKYPDGATQTKVETRTTITDLIESDEGLEGFQLHGPPNEDVSCNVNILEENGVKIKRKTITKTIIQVYNNILNKLKRTKTRVITITEDEHPDGSVITKTSENISIKDEPLALNLQHECKLEKNTSQGEGSKIEAVLKDLSPEDQSEETEFTQTEEVEEKGISIKRTLTTKTIKTKFSDSKGVARKLKIVTIVTTADQYPDGSIRTTVDTNTSVSDIESDDMLQSQELKEYSLEDKTVSTDIQEHFTTREDKEVKQKIIITTTKEILSSSDRSKKKIRTTIETVTETLLPNGFIEVTKDVKISVSDYGTETFDESLTGFTAVGNPDEHITTNVETLVEHGVNIVRKTTTITNRQEFESIPLRLRKIKTIVKTITEDEYPDGTVITKKSEKVSIADVFLKTPAELQEDSDLPESYIDDNETVEDTTEDSDIKNEIIQQGSVSIKRTITTKTKRETLSCLDENIKRVRTTVETTTVDEYPDGSTETTKDVKITISEFQKTSDSNLQAALQGLTSTGKIKTSVDKKININTQEDEKITQTITTYVTKEELKNDNTNEIAVKTVTETITENAKDDGSVETTKDLRTQITYLPIGTGLDDWSPEELEKIEKQPVVEESKPALHDLLQQKIEPELDIKSKKQRSPVGEITTDTETFTKVIKDGNTDVTQTITVVTTKEVISPEKVKITVETTTVSKGSDGVTKTTKATKTTISEFREEFEEIVDTGESEKSFSTKLSSKTGDIRSSSATSEDFDHPGISSPPSDISSRGSRAATHVWGTESSGMYYSDDEGPGSPSSTKSQVAHSPRSNLSFELDTKHQDGQDMIYEKHNISSTSLHGDPMSISIYGQLPEDDSATSSTHSEAKTEIQALDKSVIKLNDDFLKHEKLKSEHILKRSSKSDTSFLKEADEHFEKAIEEHKKVSGSEVISNITAKYEFDKSSHTSSHHTSSKEESTITLKDIKTDSKKVVESSSSSSKEVHTKHDKHEQKSESHSSKDPIESWGKPLGLPSPIMPPQDGKSTPKKQAATSAVLNKNKLNQEKSKEVKSRAGESPSKKKTPAPVYMELTYVPHHGNSYYSAVEFFKRVRARYYVFSGTEPSKEIYNALLDAKKTWEDKDLEVTIIPTYDTDVLGYWVTENEEALEKYKIDLSPSASRCTINLQDHETSCAAYRLEF